MYYSLGANMFPVSLLPTRLTACSRSCLYLGAIVSPIICAWVLVVSCHRGQLCLSAMYGSPVCCCNPFPPLPFIAGEQEAVAGTCVVNTYPYSSGHVDCVTERTWPGDSHICGISFMSLIRPLNFYYQKTCTRWRRNSSSSTPC